MLAHPSAGRMLCQHSGKYLSSLRSLTVLNMLMRQILSQPKGPMAYVMCYVATSWAVWLCHVLHGFIRLCMHVQRVPFMQVLPAPCSLFTTSLSLLNHHGPSFHPINKLPHVFVVLYDSFSLQAAKLKHQENTWIWLSFYWWKLPVGKAFLSQGLNLVPSVSSNVTFVHHSTPLWLYFPIS